MVSAARIGYRLIPSGRPSGGVHPLILQTKAAREPALSEPATEADASAAAKRQFRVLLIKPSHYDDDGYVIRWYRNFMPSNSLAAVYAIAAEAARIELLGPDVEIEVTPIDETNTRVRFETIIAEFRRDGNFGFVGLVGVQSNQYPRALDIARPLRAVGIPVVIGGFHVSGMLAMFPTVMADLQEALDMGVSLFAGEAEGRLELLIRDIPAAQVRAAHGRQHDDLRRRSRLPVPMLVLHHHQRAGAQIAQAQPG
jgi:hypothetical protein